MSGSFDELSRLIQSGLVDQYYLVPSTHTLTGPGNVKIKVKTNGREGGHIEESSDEVKEWIVRLDPETNKIYPPNPRLEQTTYPDPGPPKFRSVLNAFDDWKVGKYIETLDSQITDTDRMELMKTPRYQWSSGKTFNDLVALNLAFIQGFIPQTPYHFGPLDPESNLILDELNLLNRLDMVTQNSQPFEIFPDFEDEDTMIRQYPYVDFYFPRHKSEELDNLIRSYISTSQVYHTNMETGELTVLVEPNPELITFNVDGKIPSAIYIKGDHIKVEEIPSPITEIFSHYQQLLGDNFYPLVINELDFYSVYDLRLANEIFSELAGLAKHLI